MELGAFRIHSFLAAGGGGAVFRGEHVRSGMPTAIKTVFRSGSDPSVRIELEALAGLVHPHIIGIHDFGVVPEPFELGGIATPAGSIWIAMELGQESLHDQPPQGWEEVRQATEQLLGALAFAHARGVLHRDVKPQNTLWTGGRRLKLSDFGVAVLDGRTPSRMAGTLPYMAPEQAVGDLDRLGPWTDLFALGVTVWGWVCGDAPFKGLNQRQVLMRKLREHTEDFTPQFAVPPQLHDWLQVCLRAAPTDRFEFAADASFALSGLTAPRGRATGPRRVSNEEETATVVSTSNQLTEALLPSSRHVRPSPAPMTTAFEVDQATEVALLDAGLELFGLRSTPLVGRDPELGELWRLLAQVRRSQTPMLAVVTGAPGLGRRSVMRTLAERAHATGAAVVWRLLAGEDRCRATLVERFGEDAEAIESSLLAFTERYGDLDPTDLRQITSACLEGVDSAPALGIVAHRLSLSRPLILEIEDLHIGVEAWLEALLAQNAAVLVVATVPERALQTLSDWGQTLLRLSPLDEDVHLQVCRTLLGLEPELGTKLAKLSDGNPGLAVQICDHWVQNGWLVASPLGHGLERGARASLPESSWWSQQVAALGLSTRELALVRIAAHLGSEVEASVLAAAGAFEDLLEILVRRRIVSRTQSGFRWTHPAFREAVLELELEKGVELASRAADLLQNQSHRGVERVHCLTAAGRYDEAVPLLESVMCALDEAGHHLEVLPLWELWSACVEARPDVVSEVVEIAYLKGLRGIGGRERLADAVPRAKALAEQHGWKGLASWARFLEVPLLDGDQRPDRIAALLEEMSQIGEGELQIEVLHSAAQYASAKGQAEVAVEHHERAVEIADRIGLEKVSFYRIALARSLSSAGQTEIARVQLLKAREEARRRRRGFSEFFSWYIEGTLHFGEESYSQARDAFRKACELAQRIGNHQEWFVRAQSGICELLIGDPDQARTDFFSCLNAPTRAGHLFAHAGMLALEEEEEGFSSHWAFLEERWFSRALGDPIMAEALAVAADRQLESGHRERARKLYFASADQLDHLGRTSTSVRRLAERL